MNSYDGRYQRQILSASSTKGGVFLHCWCFLRRQKVSESAALFKEMNPLAELCRLASIRFKLAINLSFMRCLNEGPFTANQLDLQPRVCVCVCGVCGVCKCILLILYDHLEAAPPVDLETAEETCCLAACFKKMATVWQQKGF